LEELVFSIEDPLRGLNQLEHPIFDAHFHVWDPAIIGYYAYVARGYGLGGFLPIADPGTRDRTSEFFPSQTTCFAYYLPSRSFAHYRVSELLDSLEEAQKNNYKCLKCWFGPRFLDWAQAEHFHLDSPRLSSIWAKIEEMEFKAVDIHIGDPDIWYAREYRNSRKYGTKKEALEQFTNILGEYPSIRFIGVHMAGHPEHLDTLSDVLQAFPNLFLDTASTRWMIRELGKDKQRDVTREFFLRHSSRILFGSDISVGGEHQDNYYQTRYWSQRLFWETSHTAPLPFEDKDNPNGTIIRGLALPKGLLRKFYWENARRILGLA
jgi:hypothetical protein